ncbi:MAG: tRNA 2-thiouridine(34) synthase MnmA [Bacteriovoracaceae bacterium]
MEKSVKKTIVVGLSGGADSAAAAYLLKKQGHNVIGMAINFTPAAGEEHLSKRFNSEGKVIEERGPFLGVHLIDSLEDIKKLCVQIDIPFYAVNAQKIYQDRVTDFMVAARLGGLHFSPKISSTSLIIDILHEKAKLLKADQIATGHFAKNIFNFKENVQNILSSNDLENDQSFYLSSLKQEQLRNLIFPLSDMRQSEVDKIIEMAALKVKKRRDPNYKVMQDPKMAVFVEERVPYKMLKSGNMFHYIDDMVLGEHPGIHHFYLGQIKPPFKANAPVDKDLMIATIRMNNGHINLVPSNSIKVKHLVLKGINLDPSLDFSRPLDVYFKISARDELSPATVTVLNNQVAFVELKEDYKSIIFPGDYLACYNKTGPSAKILLAGEVKKSGHIDQNLLRFLPKTKAELEEEEENPKNIDIYTLKH